MYTTIFCPYNFARPYDRVPYVSTVFDSVYFSGPAQITHDLLLSNTHQEDSNHG